MRYVLAICLAFLFVGCGGAKPKPLYSWGDYQNAQIKYSKNTNDKKALEEYEKSLRELVKQDKIPPSVCSEYALVLVKLDRQEEAKEYFLKEIKNYPESQVFIKNVMDKIYGGEQ